MANKKYKVKNTNLLHDGKVYKIGTVLELDETQAAKLADVLTVVKTTENKTSKPKTETTNKEKTPKDGGEQ